MIILETKLSRINFTHSWVLWKYIFIVKANFDRSRLKLFSSKNCNRLLCSIHQLIARGLYIHLQATNSGGQEVKSRQIEQTFDPVPLSLKPAAGLKCDSRVYQ